MHDAYFGSSEPANKTILSTTDFREMDSLSEEITATIVEHSDRSYDQIGPLGEQIDTDALDSLFDPTSEGPRINAHFTFQFEDWQVDVDSNGYFQVKWIE